jgi:hypothetical protein
LKSGAAEATPILATTVQFLFFFFRKPTYQGTFDCHLRSLSAVLHPREDALQVSENAKTTARAWCGRRQGARQRGNRESISVFSSIGHRMEIETCVKNMIKNDRAGVGQLSRFPSVGWEFGWPKARPTIALFVACFFNTI